MSQVSKYPFSDQDDDCNMFEELKFLSEYILDRQEPGSAEIVALLHLVDAGLTDVLQMGVNENTLCKIQSCSLDRMTLRYLTIYHNYITNKMSYIDEKIESIYSDYDTSYEALKPVVEPDTVKLWRRSLKRHARIEAREEASFRKAEARINRNRIKEHRTKK
jgi:hypothetical protein